MTETSKPKFRNCDDWYEYEEYMHRKEAEAEEDRRRRYGDDELYDPITGIYRTERNL